MGVLLKPAPEDTHGDAALREVIGHLRQAELHGPITVGCDREDSGHSNRAYRRIQHVGKSVEKAIVEEMDHGWRVSLLLQTLDTLRGVVILGSEQPVGEQPVGEIFSSTRADPADD